MSSPNSINFERALFMLDHMDVSDFIEYWMAFGPSRLGPAIERSDPWWRGIVELDSTQ